MFLAAIVTEHSVFNDFAFFILQVQILHKLLALSSHHSSLQLVTFYVSTLQWNIIFNFNA